MDETKTLFNAVANACGTALLIPKGRTPAARMAPAPPEQSLHQHRGEHIPDLEPSQQVEADEGTQILDIARNLNPNRPKVRTNPLVNAESETLHKCIWIHSAAQASISVN